MTAVAAGAVALAFALDAAVAEPPERAHPVVWFGSAVAAVDRDWPTPRLAGAVAALALPALAAVVVAVVTWAAATVHPALGGVVAGLVLFAATSLRMLLDAARDVTEQSASDLDAARESLRALAGRDAAALSPGQVRSAAAESLAENLADGLVAPLLAFAACTVVSLPVAAAAAAWVKAVNTMDSMLGYRSKPVGWASARLDDAVMWLPARASALLVAVAAASDASPRRSLTAARSWAGEPPSPNSGWPMATLAAVLDARFEKPGAYTLNSAAALPSVADVERGVRVVRRAGLLAWLGTGVVAWL